MRIYPLAVLLMAATAAVPAAVPAATAGIDSATSSAPAAWLHACPAGPKPTRYELGAGARLAGCDGAALALPAGAQVESLYPLDPGETPASTILLHGNLSEGRFAVSEHALPGATPAPAPGGALSAPGSVVSTGPVALGANLLDGLHARAFGVEERVTAQLSGGRLRIACRAGNRAAGVVLTGAWTLPHARLALRAHYTASSAFAWQAADAAHVARDAALDLGALPGAARPIEASLALPDGLDRAAWRQFVVLCPATQAVLEVETLALTAAPSAQRQASRATWIWRPGDWIDNGPALLDWAAAQGMSTLFVTVPLKDGAAVRAPELLADFVRAAGSRNIQVYSVDGDPHMVLAAELPAVVKRAQAYAAYNAAAAPDARLAGVQFDVEPYLLPEGVLAAAKRDARYLAMAQALRAALDGAAAPARLQLEFVVPFWWGGKRALLDALAPFADALAVMDYRTDPAQIADFARPFLDWAGTHGRRARIALEAGAIDPETQRRYTRAAPGEAADLLEVDLDGRRVLALLREPLRAPLREPLPASAGPAAIRGYRLSGSRIIDGSATTFHADKAALLRLLPRLEADFGAFDGFGGIAIHELR